MRMVTTSWFNFTLIFHQAENRYLKAIHKNNTYSIQKRLFFILANYVVEINKRLVNAALAPANRLCDTYKLMHLIAEINQVYMTNYSNAAIRQLNTSKFKSLTLLLFNYLHFIYTSFINGLNV